MHNTLAKRYSQLKPLFFIPLSFWSGKSVLNSCENYCRSFLAGEVSHSLLAERIEILTDLFSQQLVDCSCVGGASVCLSFSVIASVNVNVSVAVSLTHCVDICCVYLFTYKYNLRSDWRASVWIPDSEGPSIIRRGRSGGITTSIQNLTTPGSGVILKKSHKPSNCSNVNVAINNMHVSCINSYNSGFNHSRNQIGSEFGVR